MRCSVVIVIGSKPERFEPIATALGTELVSTESSDPAPWPSVSWTDPTDGRTIGRAPFARFRRHAAAWRLVVELDAPALVVEDDAVFTDDVVDALKSLDDAPDWSVALLDDEAAAYVCTPDGARSLLDPAVLDDAIPLPALMDGSGAGAIDVVRFDPRIAGVATAIGAVDDEPEQSHLVVLAIDDRRELPDALLELDPRTLVVAVARDHVLLAGVDELLATYASVAGGAVAVAATDVAPEGIDDHLVDAHPEPGTPYRFVSGAAIAGPAGAIADAHVGRDEDDDAIALTGAYLEGLVALDSSCALFHVSRGGGGDAVAINGRLVVGATGATPPIVVQGDDAAAFESIRVALADGGSRDLARVFRYDDAVDLASDASGAWSSPAPDIVQLPFWTPEFCSTIVRLVEAAEAWDRDEVDPVPGWEVSLAALSPRLFGHIQVHLRARVLPVLREVWPEVAGTDLHDAFVIKYAAGPFDELRLHHDVAQISGTVRLNDGYTGGALEFPRQGWDNRSVPVGNLVVWPALVTHPHRSTPVHTGVKYGLTLWWKLPE